VTLSTLGAALLGVVLWRGTARVDRMIWESGGEHPYTTDFTLEYRETSRSPIRDATGAVIGHRVRLVPSRIALRARHEVRGLLNCTGGGQEMVADAPDAALVVPVGGSGSGPGGVYQLVLPRAIGAYACGNKRNAGDRRVSIGTGLFPADVEVEDAESRSLEGNASRMRGAYQDRHSRNYSASAQHRVRYEFNVEWDLHRVME
jgi:hypothetical protein